MAALFRHPPIARLDELRLIERAAGMVYPLPALARFALADADIRESREVPAATNTLL